MSKTSSYIILLGSLLFLFIGSFPAIAQKKENKENKDSTRLWQGVLVEADVIPVIQSSIMKSNSYNYQGNVQLNLKNKYYPTLEAGLGRADKTSENGPQFKTTGMFGKIGLDVPIFGPNEHSTQKNNVFLAGFRLGMSRFNYSIYNLTFTDDYWGGSEISNIEAERATKFWFEVNVGLRVEVFKNIYMGWTVKNRRLLNKAKEGETAPWFIPGYGKGTNSGWGFNYTVGYKLK